ncbi:MAG TPA: hypothetical protein VJV79_02570, partial [Polyangiaceae bacterium]|nr:hypothetical protein [Polyangiaceae bacterium]
TTPTEGTGSVGSAALPAPELASSKAGTGRASGTKAAVPGLAGRAQSNKIPAKDGPAEPASARTNTSTDMGF